MTLLSNLRVKVNPSKRYFVKSRITHYFIFLIFYDVYQCVFCLSYFCSLSSTCFTIVHSEFSNVSFTQYKYSFLHCVLCFFFRFLFCLFVCLFFVFCCCCCCLISVPCVQCESVLFIRHSLMFHSPRYRFIRCALFVFVLCLVSPMLPVPL